MAAQYNQSVKILQYTLTVNESSAGLRLDQALSQQLPDYSRSKIQDWIKHGFIQLNNDLPRPRDKVFAGDQIRLDIPETTKIFDRPEDIEFEILYQDDDIFVINRPAGLVVHPAAGHESGTLVNGLLHRDARLEQLPRAGIVHRLDKDTTGLMVGARKLAAHSALVEQLQARRVKREYVAIARGVITAGRSIETGIGRHPVERKKMLVQENGKPALTHFQVTRKFAHHSLIRLQLETGRTHQIRVHMAHIKHPLLGDPVYGGRSRLPSGADARLLDAIRNFKRQALHAARLSFEHPRGRERVAFEAPLPEDFRQLLAALERYD